MRTLHDIQRIISICRQAGEKGLGNGNRAIIPELKIDILTPPNDFLGVGSNPAIFINAQTFNLLGKHHQWLKNQTIAVKKNFLNFKPMQKVGILVHEAGHAFNVAAHIANTEANAYIFEIEVLTNWHLSFQKGTADFTENELLGYWSMRLPYFRQGASSSTYLAMLIADIEKSCQDSLHSFKRFPKQNHYFQYNAKQPQKLGFLQSSTKKPGSGEEDNVYLNSSECRVS